MDNITPRYLIVQFIGLLGTALYLLSYQKRENKKLFRMQMFSYVLYTVHMLLLGAYTGGASYMVNCLRSACLSSKRAFPKSRGMCALLCLLQLLILPLTWGGWISLLPVFANIASTLGGYTKNPRKIRLAGMLVNSPLYIVYDIIVGSWAGILDELLSEASMIVSVLRFGWKSLDKAEE